MIQIIYSDIGANAEIRVEGTSVEEKFWKNSNTKRIHQLHIKTSTLIVSDTCRIQLNLKLTEENTRTDNQEPCKTEIWFK